MPSLRRDRRDPESNETERSDYVPVLWWSRAQAACEATKGDPEAAAAETANLSAVARFGHGRYPDIDGMDSLPKVPFASLGIRVPQPSRRRGVAGWGECSVWACSFRVSHDDLVVVTHSVSASGSRWGWLPGMPRASGTPATMVATVFPETELRCPEHGDRTLVYRVADGMPG